MKLSRFVHKRLCDLLNEQRIVVWYDAEQAFGDLVGGIKAPNAVIVSAAESILRARREAEAVYAGMNESENSAAARANLLVYIPRARGTMQEERMKDPFEIFALAGTVFGDKEEDRLQSLARQAMPERIPEVDRLFAEGKPTLALLDGLEGGERYPVLQQALGTDSPAEIIALTLCDEQKAGKIEKTDGCLEELLRMLEVEIGFKRPARVRAWDKIRQALGTYVLFSEFALDPPRPMPEAFSAVGRADETKSGRIFAACDRMRNDAALRDGYVELATRVEAELRLADQVPAGAESGQRDTFPFEERRYLARLIELVRTAGCEEARKIVVGRRLSVWKDRPERSILWAAVTRCLDFMEAAAKVEQGKPASVNNLKAMIEAYTASDGWSDLDRCQRFVEQSAVDCSEHDEIQPLVDLCRRRYREVAPSVQSRYLELVRSEGWPPEGVLKQAQIFDKRVAPLLEEKQKVAFFLVDSLRFEMGRDLAETLAVLGEHDLTPAAVVPPTYTPWGMAALLPGADGALRLIEKDGELVPAMGTRLVRNVEERNAVLRERYGDRFVDVTLDDLLTKYPRLKSKLEQVDLVVVRTQDIDQIAESLGGYQARRALSEVIGDIAKAARRVVESGFTRLVFAADHGHIMLPEIPAGDVVTPPDGDWPMAKRRCRLGRSRSSAEGTIIFKATNVGITADVEELCVPAGFKVFAAGDAYFHEGLSLQEAVVPVVVVRTKIGAAATDRAEVQIQYRSDKFTSRVIGLKLVYASLFPEPVRVRVEAYDGTGPKAVKVGEAADCDARDDASHEIVVQAGKETQVPVLLESEFSGGKIEIRVINPQNGMVWTRCELRNAMLD